jgi:hypothetical protein
MMQKLTIKTEKIFCKYCKNSPCELNCLDLINNYNPELNVLQEVLYLFDSTFGPYNMNQNNQGFVYYESPQKDIGLAVNTNIPEDVKLLLVKPQIFSRKYDYNKGGFFQFESRDKIDGGKKISKVFVENWVACNSFLLELSKSIDPYMLIWKDNIWYNETFPFDLYPLAITFSYKKTNFILLLAPINED